MSGLIDLIRGTQNRINTGIFGVYNNGAPVFPEEDFDYVKNGYNRVGAVFECVDLISKKVAKCPRIVYEVKNEALYKRAKNMIKSDDPGLRAQAILMKAESLTEVNVPDIQKLLEEPNPNMGGDVFFRNLTGLYLLRGNGFIYGNGISQSNIDDRIWSEIFLMPPDMRIVGGGLMDPVTKYILYYQTGKDQEYKASQIKHIKTFNPDYSLNGTHMYGLSPLRAYVNDLKNAELAKKQAGKQLKNGGKMGFVSPKHKEDELTEPQQNAIQESIVDAFTSETSYSRIIPSGIPVDWTEIGLDSADLKIIEMLSMTAEDVYNAYHVPLLFRSSSSTTYNDLKNANKQFIYNAVSPICDAIDGALTEFICAPYRAKGKKYMISLDYTALEELTSDMSELSTWLKEAWHITPNEKREILRWGKLKQVGMDEIWVPRSMVRMSDVVSGKDTGTPPAMTTSV